MGRSASDRYVNPRELSSSHHGDYWASLGPAFNTRADTRRFVMHLNQPHRVNAFDLRDPSAAQSRFLPRSSLFTELSESWLGHDCQILGRSCAGFAAPVDGRQPLPFTGLLSDVATKARRPTPPPDHGDASRVDRRMGPAD